MRRRYCPLTANRSLNGGLELVELDGFDEMLGKPCLQTSFNVPVIPKAADRNPRNFRYRAQLRHQFHSSSIGKGNIANEQIEFITNGSFHGRADVVRHRNQMPATHQQFLECNACVVMIVDQQNLQSLSYRVSDRLRSDSSYFTLRQSLHR